MHKDLLPLYGNWHYADNVWNDELVRVYGKAAGDARYDDRGKATPKLLELYNARMAAYEAFYAKGAELDKAKVQ
jgi:hypothetical protein